MRFVALGCFSSLFTESVVAVVLANIVVTHHPNNEDSKYSLRYRFNRITDTSGSLQCNACDVDIVSERIQLECRAVVIYAVYNEIRF